MKLRSAIAAFGLLLVVGACWYATRPEGDRNSGADAAKNETIASAPTSPSGSLTFDGSSAEAFEASQEAIMASLQQHERDAFQSDLQAIVKLVGLQDKELFSLSFRAGFDSNKKPEATAKLMAAIRQQLDGKTVEEFRGLADEGRKLWEEKFERPLAAARKSRSTIELPPEPTAPPTEMQPTTAGPIWASEEELLAAAPDVKLEPMEIDFYSNEELTLLIDVPAGTEWDENTLKLPSGERAKLVEKTWDMPWLVKCNKEMGYKGHDQVVFANDSIFMEKQHALKKTQDAPYQVKMNLNYAPWRELRTEIERPADDGGVFGKPVALEPALTMIRCLRTLRLKQPEPTEPMALLQALGVEAEPENATNPDEVVGLTFGYHTTPKHLGLLEFFPNVEAVSLEHTSLFDVPGNTLEQLQKCTRLRRFATTGSIYEPCFNTLIDIKTLQELQIGLWRDHDASTVAKIGTLPELRSLNLTTDHEAADLLDRLGACKKLEQLSVKLKGGYKDVKMDLGFLKSLPSLQSLSVTGPVEDRTLIKDVIAIPSLRSLTLQLDRFKLVNAGRLAELPKLTRLQLLLRESDLVTNGLASLEKLKLKSLSVTKHGPWVDDLGITDDHLASIVKIKSLVDLRLAGDKLTVKGLEQLKSLPELKGVKLATDGEITFEVIEQFNEDNPGLDVGRLD